MVGVLKGLAEGLTTVLTELGRQIDWDSWS